MQNHQHVDTILIARSPAAFSADPIEYEECVILKVTFWTMRAPEYDVCPLDKRIREPRPNTVARKTEKSSLEDRK